MTEQPFEPITEDEYLGNRRPAPDADVRWSKPELPEPRTNLPLEAEVHATHAVKALEHGELDAGIAWLQSALAFAQNARHAHETEAKVVNLNTAFSYDGQAVRP